MGLHRISGDMGSSEYELDPQLVADEFAKQYYDVLRNSPHTLYRFYCNGSMMHHPGRHGEMTSTMTLRDIHGKIMCSDYKGCLFKETNVVGQVSIMGGILVAVNGSFIGEDNLKRSFYQTFFLAKRTNKHGYVVLNDILRFVEALESEIFPTCYGTEENAYDVPLTIDQGWGEVLDPGYFGKKASAAEISKKLSDIRTGRKAASDEEGSNMASDIAKGRDASGFATGKKKVPDIKKTMAEVPDSSLYGCNNESTLTNVALNQKQNFKKIAYASKVAKSPLYRAGYGIVRVVSDASQQSIANAIANPERNAYSSKQELRSSNVTAGNNNVHANAEGSCIETMIVNIKKHGFTDAPKISGHVQSSDVQMKTSEKHESASATSKEDEMYNSLTDEEWLLIDPKNLIPSDKNAEQDI